MRIRPWRRWSGADKAAVIILVIAVSICTIGPVASSAFIETTVALAGFGIFAICILLTIVGIVRGVSWVIRKMF